MENDLQIFAGRHALEQIRANGLTPNDTKVMLGASGGPKWLVLKALDQYLARHWLPEIPHPIDMIGSSIGAWRMACLAQQDGAAAIQRLADDYSRREFSPQATAEEVGAVFRKMVDEILGERDFAPDRHLHIVTARCSGVTRIENRAVQLLAMASVASANALSRRSLRLFFERVVFHSDHATTELTRHHDFATHHVPLSDNNLEQALAASGAIPVVVEGVTDPAGAPPGVYRDGGMVDYHFDLPMHPDDGLVLYPHFSPLLKPGWFDKPLKHRKVLAEHYSHTVLITPSQRFIERLPGSKIPDRSDYETQGNAERLAKWRHVMKRSERLADAWHDLVDSGRIRQQVQSLEGSGLVRAA